MLVLLNIEDMLSNLGCQSVSAAATADRALALIDTEFFDAAMLDVNLGGEKSYPIADALEAHGIPFVFSTGYSGRSLSAGYQDRPMLGKPYVEADLVASLTRLLGF